MECSGVYGASQVRAIARENPGIAAAGAARPAGTYRGGGPWVLGRPRPRLLEPSAAEDVEVPQVRDLAGRLALDSGEAANEGLGVLHTEAAEHLELVGEDALEVGFEVAGVAGGVHDQVGVVLAAGCIG